MRRFPAVLLIAAALLCGCAVAAEPSSPAASAEPPATPTPPPSPTPPTPSDQTPAVDPSPPAGVQEGVVSERGLFIGSWTSVPATPPINVVHDWVLHIQTADGVPVAGALLTVDGDMPAHGHGMPTTPQVTADLGGGDYQVEGMSFQMGGYWVIDIAVTAGGQHDVIHFGLELPQ
jgi:hypothetical protein